MSKLTTVKSTMQPVNSSHIHAVGHNPETRTLHIQFKDKDGNPTHTYEYGGVTTQQHQDLMLADSQGKHFQKHIRPKHEGRKLEEE